MDPAAREQLRINLLRQLDAAGSLGFTDAALHSGARLQGYDVSLKEVGGEVDYLADPSKGLVRRVNKAISPEMRRHKITADGRDWLAEHA